MMPNFVKRYSYFFGDLLRSVLELIQEELTYGVLRYFLTLGHAKVPKMLGLMLHVLLKDFETRLHNLLQFLRFLFLLLGQISLRYQILLQIPNEDLEGVFISNLLVYLGHLHNIVFT